MKKLLFVLSLLTLFACQEKFKSKNYRGSWINIDDKNRSYSSTITFRKDSVYFEDYYSFVTKGLFKIVRNDIFFYLKNDTLKYDFNYNQKDSTIIIGANKYGFWEEYSYNSNFKDYNLIQIKRKNQITQDSLSKLDCALHLFKDSNDSLKLRLNDKITTLFDRIPSFVILADKFDYTFPGIYVGERITIKDLIKVYIRLWSVNIKHSMLILDLDIRKNLYSNYFDNFNFWKKQFELHSEDNIEPSRHHTDHRIQYLKRFSPQIIEINTLGDFKQLASINIDNNYLIQINANLEIKNYISLKEKISKINKDRKIRIRTEFNNYLIYE